MYIHEAVLRNIVEAAFYIINNTSDLFKNTPSPAHFQPTVEKKLPHPVIEKHRKYCYNIIIKTEVKQNDYRRKNKILSSAKSDDAGKVSSRAYYILSGSFKMGEKDFP